MISPLACNATSQKTASRTRSFAGCGTCRARRIKCDERRPTCSVCATYNVVCDGYSRELFFDTDGVDGKSRHRQLLFTDEERMEMSLLMTDHVPMARALRVIGEIEETCEEAVQQSDTQVDVFRGPFGAFRLDSSKPFTEEVPDSDALTASFSRVATPNFDLMDADALRLPVWIDTASLFTEFDELSSLPAFPVPDLSTHTRAQQLPHCQPTADAQLNKDPVWAEPSRGIASPGTPDLEDAPLLLKYYANSYVPSLTPFRHSKTPWHVLFLPNAKNTLANIAIGEDVDSANLVTFFGLLSVSALHLHQNSPGQKWQPKASVLRQYAQENIKFVLAHALDRPKRFKYKSIIIAILTMAQVSMANGSWDDTDTYLLEAEKVIRLRGLTKLSKSRKVRLLHHCYAHMRIFHESLTSMSVRSGVQRLVMDAIREGGTIAKGSDMPNFRLIPWNDLDANFQKSKTRERGENDLHLSTPGLWIDTLYPEIFGIPETWMNLLSQVIRLANEKDLSDSQDERTLTLKEFSERAKALERYIIRWKPPTAATALDDRVQVLDVDCILLENMQSALHHALIVYFYRRVHDIDSNLLQHHVVCVKNVLSLCRQLCGSGGLLDALKWPAFVAGCEAIDPNLQSVFSAWFLQGMQNDKPSSLARMHQLMCQTWDLKQQSDRGSVSWWQLVGSKGDAPIEVI